MSSIWGAATPKELILESTWRNIPSRFLAIVVGGLGTGLAVVLGLLWLFVPPTTLLNALLFLVFGGICVVLIGLYLAGFLMTFHIRLSADDLVVKQGPLTKSVPIAEIAAVFGYRNDSMEFVNIFRRTGDLLQIGLGLSPKQVGDARRWLRYTCEARKITYEDGLTFGEMMMRASAVPEISWKSPARGANRKRGR